MRHSLTLGFWNSHHVRQCANGQFLGTVLNEVDTATCGFELLDDGLRIRLDRILDTPDLPRCERGADEFAKKGVPGWVHCEERLRRFEQFHGNILEDDALTGQER